MVHPFMIVADSIAGYIIGGETDRAGYNSKTHYQLMVMH